MATTTIPWGDGSGDNIYLTYTSASGNQTVQVSSDPNDGPARTKDITFVSTVGNIARVLTVIQETNMDYVSITWNDTCITYNDTAIAYPYEEDYIVFADPAVEAICVANWGDGIGLKPSQAAQVNIGTTFRYNQDITSFDEYKYFTGYNIPGSAFRGTSLTKITLPSGTFFTNSSNLVFYDCSLLEEIDFSDTTRADAVSDSQLQLFNKCSSLVKIHFDSIDNLLGLCRTSGITVTDWPFYYSTGPHYVYVGGSELINIVLPQGTTNVPPGAFYGFDRVQSITFPTTVSTIRRAALAGMYGLTDLTFPEGATVDFQASGNKNNLANGNGTGTLTINQDLSYTGNCDPRYKTIIINGDFTKNTSQFVSSSCVEVIKIKGNFTGNSGYFIYTGSTTGSNLVFLEIGGTITTNLFNNGNTCLYALSPNGTEIHLAYDGIACPVSYLAISNTTKARFLKIYVGDGSSASHDNAILASYLADTGWAAYSDKLDTWYNYVNDPNANLDYIN